MDRVARRGRWFIFTSIDSVRASYRNGGVSSGASRALE